jgi:NADH-quinone oxidoreductase subunit N
MDLAQLVAATRSETWQSLAATLPEIILTLAIVVALVERVVLPSRRADAFWIMLLGSAAAFGLAIADFSAGSLLVPHRLGGEIFSGLLIYDPFTQYLRVLLAGFAVLFVVLTRLTGVPDRDDGADLYSIALGGIVGMMMMAQANHVLMVFLALEMASIPGYVLVGLQKGERRASEAALKFSVYGAAAAGIMLYGMTLLMGALGSGHLPTMASQLGLLIEDPAWQDRVPLLLLGTVMTLVGLSFKLTAVPFHFWCPDAFEGATAEVGAYLSIASKAAAVALLVRLAMPFAEIAAARPFLTELLTLLGLLTVTFGNLAAFGQQNFKRLMAYSTIAHAGLMILPVAAAVSLAGRDPSVGLAALNVYLIAYLFMNLGAFAVIALLRNELGSERIEDSAGLIRVAPGLVVCVIALMFSLVGLPPWIGFFGKLQVFAALADAKLWLALIVAVINTVLSLVYYIRVVRVMTFHPLADSDEQPASLAKRLGVTSNPLATYILMVTLPVALLPIFWEPILAMARYAVP